VCHSLNRNLRTVYYIIRVINPTNNKI